MPGLMDFLSSDDAQLGLGLLAAGGPSAVPMSFGQRLAAGVGQAQANKDNRLRQKLLQSQVDENASQVDLRRQKLALEQRKQAWEEQFLGGTALGSAAAGTSDAPGGVGPAPMGAPSPGAAPGSPQAAGGAAAAGAQPVGGGFTAAQISRESGVPLQVIISDYKFNGGKKIAQFIEDRAKPNWVTQNGNTFDTNARGFRGGFQPGITTTANGQSLFTDVDANGRPFVMPTPGSVQALQQFADTSNRSNATFQPGRPVLGPDGRTYGQSQLAEVGGAAPPARAPVLPGRPLGAPAAPGIGRMGPTNAAEAGMAGEIANLPPIQVQQEIASTRAALQNGSLSPADRPQAAQWLQMLEAKAAGGQVTVTQGQPMIGPGAGVSQGAGPIAAPGPASAAGVASPAGALDFSPAEKATQAAQTAGATTAAQEAAKIAAANLNAPTATANDAARAAAVDTAKAGVVKDTARGEEAKRFEKMQTTAAEAFALLKGPTTGSIPGAARDFVTDAAGYGTTRSENAARLEGLSKWLTQNVPRMEGPQSDGDRKEYAAAAGNVGDRMKPASVRAAALETIMSLQAKYADINRGGASGAGGAPPPPAPPKKTFDTLPPANASNRGQRMRDTSTGKIMRSDGMSWKPE